MPDRPTIRCSVRRFIPGLPWTSCRDDSIRPQGGRGFNRKPRADRPPGASIVARSETRPLYDSGESPSGLVDHAWRHFLRYTGIHPASSAGQAFPEHAVERRRDGLHLGVVVEDELAHFATPAGFLIAAERQRGVEHVVAVDPHGAGADALGELVG